MTQMLASVASASEAMLALELGADIVDLKNPSDGALGALPLETIRCIVAIIDGRCMLSATIGDPPEDMTLIPQRIAATANTGVDIVKVGVASNRYSIAAWQGMACEPMAARLVAVLFADQHPDFAWIEYLAACGFYGVMLDTADKRSGGLRRHLDDTTLREFVQRARLANLACGLAGSLRVDDVAPLLAMNPDYLGFRGALCRNAARTGVLDPDAFRAVRACLTQHVGWVPDPPSSLPPPRRVGDPPYV